MAAQAWTLYNKAKKNVGNGNINLGSGNFRMTLHTSASNAATLTLSTYGSLTGECTEANGYSSSGKACTTRVWTVGASAKQYKFDVDDLTWTGTGGAISNIKFAVIWQSGGKLLCRASLTSSQFTLASGNTMTIQINSAGVFTLA